MKYDVNSIFKVVTAVDLRTFISEVTFISDANIPVKGLF